AAVASKETGVCYPLLIVIVLLHRYGDRDETLGERLQRCIVPALALLLPLPIYFAMRFVALDHALFATPLPGSPINALTGLNLMGRLIGSLTVLGEYVRLLFFPLTLSCDYGLGAVDPRNGLTIAAALGALAAIGLIWLVREWWIRWARLTP